LVVLHEENCLRDYDLCKAILDLMKCKETLCPCISVKLCFSMPLQSIVLAYVKTIKAFEKEINVAKYKEVEMLLKLFGVRQIKSVMKVLNDYCKKGGYAITIVHIDKSLLSKETVDSMVEVITRKLNSIGCSLIDYQNLNMYNDGCDAAEALLPMLRKYCNNIILMGISGTTEVFIS